MIPMKTAAPLSDQFLKNAEAIRRRAMESLFERLESLCEGAIAIDRGGRVIYVNDKYLPMLGLSFIALVIFGLAFSRGYWAF